MRPRGLFERRWAVETGCSNVILWDIIASELGYTWICTGCHHAEFNLFVQRELHCVIDPNRKAALCVARTIDSTCYGRLSDGTVAAVATERLFPKTVRNTSPRLAFHCTCPV